MKTISSSFVLFVSLFVLTTSCTHRPQSESYKKSFEKQQNSKFILKERESEFDLEVVHNYHSKTNEFLTVKKIYNKKTHENYLEKSLTISRPGKIKVDQKYLPILRPYKSHFEVFFDKEKHLAQLLLDDKTKKFKFYVYDPREKLEKTYLIDLPSSRALYCFFSQIDQCLKFTNLFKKLEKNKNQTINLYIVWDSYPFVQMQHPNLQNNIYTKSSFSFENEVEGQKVFGLKFNENVIFYFFNQDYELVKLDWPNESLQIFKEE